ncbi:cytochrome b/b6 domain-containing protein [Pararhizobium mangrovi]|uniref:Cytochrome b/b6 domain-containing protein n=1 Tax=Pararhizobium mangrovi TaxID=2590452 RepID=A0A506UHN0_9HYPH|nr:cytochrome b/b6 domain-containing protein [Pararhizobium mangrovi]TPW32825.1 cytochrome b/b6 domain-containing protein [Pararhizobium mangrovi]
MVAASRERADTNASPHALPTRWAHAGLAIAVLVQLATSQFMQGPRDNGGDWLFTIHEISGITALVFAFSFWLVVALRRRGTSAGKLFPWFSGRGWRLLGGDILRHAKALVRFRLPEYQEHSPLPSAIHGLGLLLMSGMAATGFTWFFFHLTGLPGGGIPHAAMFVHHLFANLVWAYLIGHGLLALVHHFAGQASIARMWSVRPSGRSA